MTEVRSLHLHLLKARQLRTRKSFDTPYSHRLAPRQVLLADERGVMRDRHIETLRRLIARTYAEVAADRTRYERARVVERALHLIRRLDRMQAELRDRGYLPKGAA